jgi:hypothetical protein
MNRSAWAARAASSISPGVTSREAPYAMFSAIVPPNSQVSWSTMPIPARRSSRDMRAMSTPSRVIRPPETS